MVRELCVSEMRYRAVLEVLDGAMISAVARRYGVSRQRCMHGCVVMRVMGRCSISRTGRRVRMGVLIRWRRRWRRGCWFCVIRTPAGVPPGSSMS
jgi:hypothetical protein